MKIQREAKSFHFRAQNKDDNDDEDKVFFRLRK